MSEKIEGPTPCGGNYAILYYYDKNGKTVEKTNAEKCIACEFDKEGKLLRETTLISNKEQIKKENSEN